MSLQVSTIKNNIYITHKMHVCVSTRISTHEQ